MMISVTSFDDVANQKLWTFTSIFDFTLLSCKRYYPLLASQYNKISSIRWHILCIFDFYFNHTIFGNEEDVEFPYKVFTQQNLIVRSKIDLLLDSITDATLFHLTVPHIHNYHIPFYLQQWGSQPTIFLQSGFYFYPFLYVICFMFLCYFRNFIIWKHLVLTSFA